MQKTKKIYSFTHHKHMMSKVDTPYLHPDTEYKPYLNGKFKTKNDAKQYLTDTVSGKNSGLFTFEANRIAKRKKHDIDKEVWIWKNDGKTIEEYDAIYKKPNVYKGEKYYIGFGVSHDNRYSHFELNAEQFGSYKKRNKNTKISSKDLNEDVKEYILRDINQD